MKKSISKLHYLLFALLLTALTGCGASNLAGTGDNTPGTITGKLAYGDSKTTAKSVASAPAGVTSIKVVVTGTGTDGKAIPVVKGTFDAASSSGSIGGIYPGKVTVSVSALNSSGATLYEGFAIGVAVNPGATSDAGMIVMTPPVAKAENAPCINCHENTLDVTGQNLVANYKQSGHYTNTAWTTNFNGATQAGCAGCHGTQHNDVNPATSGRCFECHGANLGLSHQGSALQYSCNKCHSPHNTQLKGCVDCHAVGQNATALGNFVNDNNGVRAIVGEFSKWSHHVTGVKLDNAHCAACHLEGKITNGVVATDPSKHMVDNKIHLRDTTNNTDADFAWDPAAPNHSGMDTFCLSCHDSNGATSTESARIQAYINAKGINAPGKTASPSNPFGDTISNRYDKMERPAVVDAKGQFATTNASHHAVLGKRYTGRTRVGSDRAVGATFAQNSSSVLYGKRTTIYDANKFNGLYTTLGNAGGETDVAGSLNGRNGGTTLGDDSTLHCGDCHTVGQYRAADVNVKPFNKAVIGAHGSNNEYLLRNSIGTDERHYGWKYSGNGISTDVGQPMLVCFMCHNNKTPLANGTGPYNDYGATGNNSGNHAGEYAENNRCNGSSNTITFSGYTTSVNDEHEPYAFRLGLGIPDNPVWGSTTTTDTDFSNLFGIQCANCHNSGPDNAFGGIHGSRVNVYTDANGSQQKPYRFLPGLGNTMFIPGVLGKVVEGKTRAQADALGLQGAYSSAVIGAVSDLNWEQRYLATQYNNVTLIMGYDPIGPATFTAGPGAGGKITNDNTKNRVVDNSGCYTLVPEEGPGSATTTKAGAQPVGYTYTANAPYSYSPAFEQQMGSAANVKTGNKMLFGEWGGCDDHRGNAHGKAFSTGTVMGKNSAGADTGWIDPDIGGTVNTGGAGVIRKVLRPVTY